MVQLVIDAGWSQARVAERQGITDSARVVHAAVLSGGKA